MTKEIIGLITCALCGSEDATVHEEAKGRPRKKYYRCYDSIGGGVGRCGTIQCRYEYGQKFIMENMRPYGIGLVQPPAPVFNPIATEVVAKVDLPAANDAVPEKKSGVFDNFLTSLGVADG